ncbi:Alcohol acetyltransferase [Sporothrix curviconia]|uniref:Alcohol acetyltransferase n=1 Tax=Sporothrix curviconia TaxID=1260050 RepID=A0ABP0ATQ5_9PEZI
MALPRTVLRPLGGEQYSSSRHSLGLYQNVITVCRYALPAGPQRRPDEAQVKASMRQALKTVVLEKLPSLRVGVKGEDTKQPVFVSLPSLDLREHLEWVARTPGQASDAYDAQLMRDLERENARPWLDVATHSPWRVIVYLNTADGWADVAFAVHHALADGMSGAIFHGHLVETLNSQAERGVDAAGDRSDKSEQGDMLAFTEQPTIIATQEDLVKFTLSWSYTISTVWRELAPAWLKGVPKAEAYTGHRVTLEPKLKGNLRVFHLTPDHAAALLAGCHAHGVTLTALMHVLLMVLFARRLPADVASSFKGGVPVNMRPYVRKPADHNNPALDVFRSFGNFVASYFYTYGADAVADGRAVAATASEDDEKVWRAASQVGTDLKARLANITEDNVLGLMGWISDWHDWWRKHEGKIRESTWYLSNTGSIPATGGLSTAADAAESPASPPQWMLTRNFYTQSSLGKDALINLNIGGIRGGEMSFIVAWHHGVTEDEFGDNFAKDLRACLERFATSGHFGVPSRLSE